MWPTHGYVYRLPFGLLIAPHPTRFTVTAHTFTHGCLCTPRLTLIVGLVVVFTVVVRLPICWLLDLTFVGYCLVVTRCWLALGWLRLRCCAGYLVDLYPLVVADDILPPRFPPDWRLALVVTRLICRLLVIAFTHGAHDLG